MKIKHNVTPKGLYIYFEGELDEHHASNVRDKIDCLIDRYSSTVSVVFNMRNLTFMDSTGIGVLIGRYKKLKNMKIPAYIENPSFSADKVFSVSGIYKLIPKI
ncbi:MAG: anti-sigma factor antagonist [Clostridia bacterium]|nr:anti-sigma factor antagonist [Clostridia bacterium]